MTEYKGFSGNTEAAFKQMYAYLWSGSQTGDVVDGVIDHVGNALALRVTQTATASASVDVYRGLAVVQDSLLNGATPLLSDTTKTLDILTANPMGALPRNDIVAFDAATTSIRNILGTANASPTDPTVPATAVPLARLRHAANATTVPAASIDDLRVITRLAGTFVKTSEAAAGSATLASTAAATTRSVAITFPAGRFTAAPKVMVQNPANFFADPLLIWVTAISATGATINAYRNATAWGPATVDWIAVQSL